MSNTSYRVVFEYTPDAGGFAFIRTIINYASEAEFQERYQINPREKIIAQGVSEDEATNLCHLTPTICYYLSAVEEFFETGKPSWDLEEYFFMKAEYAVMHIHELREQAGLSYTAPDGLEEHLDSITQSADYPKGFLMTAFILAYDVFSDTLNKEMAAELCAIAIRGIKKG